MSVARAIENLVEGAVNTQDFVVRHGADMVSYTVEWLNSDLTEPTSSAIEAKRNELYAEDNLNALRVLRNNKLAETDHWALSDTDAMTQAQTDYRQTLRDITKTYTSIDDVVWPTKP
jgi:hypothetical protein